MTVQDMKTRKFDHQILLLQGGGALGAYHAGVYEGMAERGRELTWVVGVSIGSIVAALIAGNSPDKRLERLRAFWHRVSDYGLPDLPIWFEAARPALNFMSAAAVSAFGSPGFFRPRVPPPVFSVSGSPETVSFYDTSQLKATLEELVDFDLLNSGEVRVSLGAANVRTGASVYFDNRTTRLTPEHVMASGALPPGFPAVKIDGEHYWDGGIVSNTPLHFVCEQRPLTSALILQVDLFNAAGDLPGNIDEVLERLKDIQYSSKQRFTAARVAELGGLQAALYSLFAKLPDGMKADPDVQKLATLCDNRDWLIGRLINKRLPYASHAKDYEFSRATMLEHWAAGLEDFRKSVANFEWIKPTDLGPGVRVYELPGEAPIVPPPLDRPETQERRGRQPLTERVRS
jgi:NTE family protein